MNRQKKIQDIYSKRLKRAKAKRNPNNKPKYISKADRAKLELNEQGEATCALSDVEKVDE